MSNTQGPAAINLKFLNLPDADQAVFERVLSFFASKGNLFTVAADASSDLIITTDEPSHIEAALNLKENNLLLVISDDKNCPHGDLQLQRPLLVTRVMRLMEQAAQLHQNPPDTDEASATPPPVSAPEEKPKQQYTALVIDDNAAIRKQLEIELRTSGIPSQAAESGEQALDIIESATFDLIFLDIMMPGIDGYETCGRIRSNPSYKRTPVIMLSGKTAPLDEVKGVIAGATTYLTKPIKHDEFQQVLQRITRWLSEFR